jgi:cobalt-zinc-cadmium efflux system protein
VLVNAAILLVSVGAIGVEAIRRLVNPQPVVEMTVIWVAVAGIVVNGATALMFMRGRGEDLNVRSQFVHMAGDAGVSLGVVVAGVLIQLTAWYWLDPVASLGIALIIVVTTWGLLRESVDLAMDAVPTGVAEGEVLDYLAAVPGVEEVHDLHIWGLSTTETALTAHLVCSDDSGDRRLHEVTAELRHRFGIGHATLQIETSGDAEMCRLRPRHVV